MTFPVYFHVLGQRVHPHLVMEVIAYAAGFQAYRLMRRRARRAGDAAAVLPFEQNVWVIVGCVLGAVVGIVWQERGLSFAAVLRKLRRAW